ncbi:MAG: hypothetical protein AAF726_21970 [Planctomycetota bacterium]
MKPRLVLPLLLSAPSLAFAQLGVEGDPLESAPSSDPTVLPALPEGAMEEIRRAVLVDEPGDGRVWASGPTWKASFGADGFTFIPFLGSDAERNHPVHFDLSDVRAGMESIPFDAAPTVSRDGKTVTLDRGTLRETYHLSEAGVEQTFVFDEVPAEGDLVVRMAIETDLRSEIAGSGFTFTHHRGGVQYGSATAIDGVGRSLSLHQELVEGAIQIRVPQEFIDPSALPLVVDPLITTFGVTNDSRDQIAMDVAYDGSTNIYMIAYEEAQSIVDHDIRTVFYNLGVGLVTNAAAIDITGDNWRHPSLASANVYSRFLCAATRGTTIGQRDIWGRARSAQSGTMTNQFVITSEPGDNAFPDVGGFGHDFNTAFPFMVVWENYLPFADDSDVQAQVVDIDGSLAGGVLDIATSDSTSDGKPRISKSSGRASQPIGQQQYLIAWEREIAADDHDLHARVVGYAGSLAGHPEFEAYSFGDSRNVDVSSQDRDAPDGVDEPTYVLVFERLRSGVWEIFAVVTREGNPDNARSLSEMQDLVPDEDHTEPRIAQDGTDDYMVVYRSAASGGFDAHMTALNIVADNGELRTGLCERRSSFSHPMGTATSVAIASTYDGGEALADSRALALWIARGAGGDDEVEAAIVQEVTSSVEGSQFCDAEPNASGRSAWIRASNSFYNAGGSIRIRVEDLPQNAFGYAIASLNTAFTPNPGGSAGNLCLGGAIGRFNGQVQDSGTAGAVQVTLDLQNIPQPNGSTSAMAGDRWKFQYWTRDSFGGMATSNFSNGVVVNFQ